MRKEKGITLIALIITIIIMLVLVAVTISIVINSGIIGKAQKAKQDTTAAYESESKLGDNITINGVEYASIDEYLEQTGNSSNGNEIKSIYNEGSYAFILKENGELYCYEIHSNGNSEFVKYEEENATIIASNVKEYYRELNGELYYITKTNDLCCFTETTSVTAVSNVKEYYGRGYYLTMANDYCYYYWDMGTTITITIASNVKKGDYMRILSNYNK